MGVNDVASNASRRQVLQGGALAAALLAVSPLTTQANTQNPPDPSTATPAPSGRFVGKVVLITGATSGIGKTTAIAFAREGASVYFCGRREGLGLANQEEIRSFGGEATYHRADVRDEAQVRVFVDECVAAYGRIDIAFNMRVSKRRHHPASPSRRQRTGRTS